jgi:crotonobetainyl-CoA:carnitine CoA-transferase CaiB-like acyl-CoA transferase
MQQLTGEEPRRSDFLFSHRYACYNTYETEDGRYISIGAVELRFWKVLCESFGVPEYIDHQYNEDRRHEIIEFFRNRIKAHPLSHWEKELAGKDVCCAVIKPMAEVLEDPLFKAREMVVEIDNPGGAPLKALGTPIKLSRTPGGVRSLPPDFGESTRQILREFGYSETDIEGFEKDGTL